MKKLLLLSILFTAVLVTACGQKIEIKREELISGNIHFPLNEAHMITDPNDPNHVLVAAILTKKWEKGNAPESYIVLLQSWDNGTTWKEKHFNDYHITKSADPWLAINSKGTVLLTALNQFSDRKNNHLIVFVSTNSGESWQNGYLNLGTGHDRQSIVVDPKTQDFLIVSGKGNPNQENKSTFGISVSRLTRDGNLREANWHALSNIDKNNGTPLITHDGDLIVPFVDYMVNQRMLDNRRNWIIRSKDLGRTFSEPYLLSEGGGFPRILLDTFNVNKPILHCLIENGPLRSYVGFSVKSSNDYGFSWGEEVDVDQYAGDTPYIRDADWIMNKKGQIGFFWFDRRNSEEINGHDLYFTYSDDHAQSFKQPVKISSSSSKPNPDKNGMVDEIWPTGGHYFGIGTTPQGEFRVVWVDHRNGYPQLFHVLVGID